MVTRAAVLVSAFVVSLLLLGAAGSIALIPGPTSVETYRFDILATHDVRPQASPGTWTLLGSQPPGRDGHGFVYDSKIDRFILFGGAITANGFTNSTWSYNYNSNAWANVSPPSSPSPRAGFGMVYDSDADRVILFGGVVGLNMNGETWAFDATNDTWTNEAPPSPPAARSLMAMAYDARVDRTILFGGAGFGGFLGDTWAYDYSANRWTAVNTSGPAGRYLASMTYDASSDRSILFGGVYLVGGAPAAQHDTWAFDYANATWTNRNPASYPSARGGSAMAFDAVANQTILFGGANPFGNPVAYHNDTWTYDQGTNRWTNVTPVAGPSVRFLAAIDYDGPVDRTVLFGGVSSSGTPLDDAWKFQLSAPAPTPPSAPRTLQAVAGVAQVTLNWQAPASDGGSPVTDYKLYRGTTASGETFLTSVGNVLTYTDSAVTGGQTYYYEISAVNAAGEGPKSNEASATPTVPPAPPSAPRSLAATARDAEVTLTWQTPTSSGTSPITGYDLYRGTTSGGETLRAPIQGNVLIFNDTGLTNGQTYYYEVSAVSADGEGPRSNEVSAVPTPPPDTTTPTIAITSPANNSMLSSTTVTVRGTASDNVAVQLVELSTDGIAWKMASGTTSWSRNVTLQVGTNTIYARATDSSGNRATVRISVTIQATGPGPQGLSSDLLVFIVLIVAIAAIAVIILLRRRGKAKAPPPAQPPPSTGTP